MKRVAIPLLAFVVPLASCAALFDDAVQCSSDADCAQFDAVCNVVAGICINREADSGSDPDPTPPTDDDAGTGPGPDPNRCNVSPKPTATIGTPIAGGTGARSEIAGAVTLGCDKDWVLDTLVFVRAAATLTIEPGTTVRAKTGIGAGIIVSRGGRIVAQGKRDSPIVFTSDAAAPAAGNWRGVYILGQAPPAGLAPFDDDPDLAWGGANAADDSGVFSYLRIEYARAGLVFAGAGTKTTIDSVEVRRTIENCFTFLGGSADAKHLVCQAPGDDQLETTRYSGRMQFVFAQRSPPAPVTGANGLLFDSSHPHLYNATICGNAPTPNGYGMVFRNNSTLDLHGVILEGWATGIDAIGAQPAAGDMHRSIVFGNGTNPAYVEDPDEVAPALIDDDDGFDEIDWYVDPLLGNSLTTPALIDCFDPKAPRPWPQTSLTANDLSPPADGFYDPAAKYIGAFKDATDPWMTGAWVRFDDK